MNYYNEFDKNAAEWLRQLIALGAIPVGEVDERSIRDVTSGDLNGYKQCHFFAGIAGWSLALERAGIPSDRPLWTGSCPCQAFSCAGKQKGFADERDLWPEFFRLIRECRPERVLGEQVEGAVRHGWLDRLQSDMEGEGYTVGATVLGAHSAGADHIRQRLYWVADAERQGREGFEQIKCPFSCASSAHSFNCHHVADARKALVGDLTNLRPYDGFRLQVARSEIKGYGNAICVDTAALFIRACEDVLK